MGSRSFRGDPFVPVRGAAPKLELWDGLLELMSFLLFGASCSLNSSGVDLDVFLGLGSSPFGDSTACSCCRDDLDSLRMGGFKGCGES